MPCPPFPARVGWHEAGKGGGIHSIPGIPGFCRRSTPSEKMGISPKRETWSCEGLPVPGDEAPAALPPWYPWVSCWSVAVRDVAAAVALPSLRLEVGGWCPAEWWCPACADVALPPPRDAAAWGGAAATVAGNGAADMEWVPAAYSKKSQQASDEKPRPKVSGWLEYCRKAGNP